MAKRATCDMCGDRFDEKRDSRHWNDPHPDGGGVAEFDAFEVVIPLTGPAQ